MRPGHTPRGAGPTGTGLAGAGRARAPTAAASAAAPCRWRRRCARRRRWRAGLLVEKLEPLVEGVALVQHGRDVERAAADDDVLEDVLVPHRARAVGEDGLQLVLLVAWRCDGTHGHEMNTGNSEHGGRQSRRMRARVPSGSRSTAECRACASTRVRSVASTRRHSQPLATRALQALLFLRARLGIGKRAEGRRRSSRGGRCTHVQCHVPAWRAPSRKASRTNGPRASPAAARLRSPRPQSAGALF